MSTRFYCPPPWPSVVEVTGTEAHHLLHVMRLKPGEEVEVFDGLGHSSVGTIEETDRKSARVRLVSGSEREDTVPNRPLLLATAIPKGDRFRWLVEKCTELGVDEILPLDTTRSVVSPRESKIDKHRQYVLEACKQSGRNRSLELHEMQDFETLCGTVVAGQLCLIGTVSDQPATVPELHQLLTETTGPVLLVVGPEGGWTDEELELACQSGMRPCHLPGHVLRTETAGVALAACLKMLLPPH
ncbi:RsmE family RNA methyltransferase [Rubinisphaera margarita]|uniref:RsmE family RNA methyltransferase n=1 Tax=Rubinisphaera margarita TaxID=2909586 RepID=UPI001EE98570|nr:RsmE family RNA methyltransferase [Rubinisphaera margarita]MCG6157875.1 16S rRNA (uracil(1498)-N(3))-methyltransferase [Rubinisphaera margarita]